MHYERKFGSYYLFEGRQILLMSDRIAIAYDADNGALLKHGDPQIVHAYAQKMREQGAGLFDAVRVIESDKFEVNDLNRVLTTTGFIVELAARLVPGVS